tara:strand:- start:31 stop:828 length:798 start_codon:yes stop_codon:yes gene_type:complete
MIQIRLLLIVPTLNSYPIICRLVNSLKNQNYKNWRVIFVDNSKNKLQVEYLNKLCENDDRFYWFKQNNKNPGIYGAMNQGLKYAKKNEWIMFWGSDDFAPNQNVFLNIAKSIDLYKNKEPYLFICKARYFHNRLKTLQRKSTFGKIGRFLIDSKKFKSMLFLGNSPPHQGTIFSPQSITKGEIFNTSYKIAADLKFFLDIVFTEKPNFVLLNDQIVNMGIGGYSSINQNKRLREVYRAYYSKFKILGLIPFSLRYFRRILSILNK